MSNRVNSVEEIGRVLNLTDDERAGLSTPDKFRVDITPYFLSLIDPDDPNDPMPPPGHPHRLRARSIHGDDGRLAGRGSPLPSAGPRPPLPGPRPDAGHDAVRELLRYCTPVARIVGDATQNSAATTSRRSTTTSAGRHRSATCCCPAATPDAQSQAARVDLPDPPRDPTRRDIRIGSRVPVSCRSASTTKLCQMMAKYHRCG